ncbi:retrovirus-related pol polyprotein from transposon TNT 1-94 [Tanacetum coccineum]
MDYIHTTKSELGINLDIPLSKQDPLDKLNNLANKKRKHADDMHDYFKANKRLKHDFVTVKDFRDFPNTMLYVVQEIFFRLHQGPGLDDHARTFSSLLLAEVDKRNLNPLKQMRIIEQLSVSQAEVFQLESLKLLQRQLFRSLEDWEVSSLQCMQRRRISSKSSFSQVSATPLSTAFISTSIVQDFQDNPYDEKDTRSSYKYLNDLEEEYQARDLLAKSKRFFKKGTQRFSNAKATDQTECHKCGKKNKVKAQLALLSSSASVSKVATVKNKGLIAESYEWDEEEVSSDDNEMVEVKVLMTLAEENDACIGEQIPSQKKGILGVDQLTEDPSSFRQKDLVFVKSSADDTKVSIPGVERPWLSEAEVTEYDSADESLVCSTPLPPLKKLDGAKPISGSNTIKSILRSKSTFKAETLIGVKINKPSSAPTKGNKISSASKVNSAFACKLKNMKIEDDPPLDIVIKELNDLRLQICKNQSSYSRNNHQCERTDNRTYDHAEYISTMNMSQHLKILEREINPRNHQHAFKRFEACGSSTHTTTDHYDIEWFKRGEVLQAKKAKALKSTRCDIRKPIWYLDNRCSRHMTGVKSYLHKYEEQQGPKVVFGDDSTCVTKDMVQSNVMFNEKRGTIFNSNKEIVMIALRVRDVYVLDMTFSAQESCFFAKAPKNLNWIWLKRLAHLNFKTINKLAKHNIVIGLPSLVYSKDKPCSSCKKGKHHRASFKTEHTSSIKKCLYLLHIDLFRPVTPRFINHEKYTLVIVDEYSRYTWVYFLKKKSQAPKNIMSFIKRVENQNDIKVKQLRTDNGKEFRNSILINFFDEKGIS